MPDVELPSWLKKLLAKKDKWGDFELTEEDFQAAEAVARNAERTSKLAAFLDKNPDADVEQAWQELTTWREWGKKDWPMFQRQFEEAKAKAAGAGDGGTREPAATNGRKWSATAEDVYETARLHKVLDEVSEANWGRTKKWYDEEERPRLDKMAGGYLTTVIDLVKFARDPQYADIPIDDLLKEAAARGERDFLKVAGALKTERGATKKAGYDEGYARGKEEAEKAKPAETGPSGPIGAAQPSWRQPPGEAKPKTREERFASVVGTVEKKHGVKLPL